MRVHERITEKLYSVYYDGHASRGSRIYRETVIKKDSHTFVGSTRELNDFDSSYRYEMKRWTVRSGRAFSAMRYTGSKNNSGYFLFSFFRSQGGFNVSR